MSFNLIRLALFQEEKTETQGRGHHVKTNKNTDNGHVKMEAETGVMLPQIKDPGGY